MRVLALLAAGVAAVLVPHAALGVDVFVVALLVAASVWATGRRSPTAMVFGVLAIVLAGIAAWLDATWVVATDLTAACILGALAVGGVALRGVVAPLRALAEVRTMIPQTSFAPVRAFRGGVLGVVLVAPFGALFWTGDAAFAELGGRTAPSLSGLPARVLVFGLVLAGTLGLCLAARRPPAAPEHRLPKVLSRLEWAIPLVLLDALFLVFVAVQLTVLFGGHDHVLRTADLTYAEYAREGFWQLIAAATLTLGVIAAVMVLGACSRRVDVALRNALLGALLGMTLVVLASAVHRLRLYEDAFGLTRSRIAAEDFSLGLAAFLVLLLIAGCSRVVRRRLAPIAVLGAALGLLAFSISNPDGRIASRNVAHWRSTGKIDVAYLQGLSADAVPALARLPDPLRSRVLEPYSERLAVHDPWSSANVSRHRAWAWLTTLLGSSLPSTHLTVLS